jgi:hypothetical protein
MASSILSSVRYRRQAGWPPQRKTSLGFSPALTYSSLVPKALGPEFVSVLERKFHRGRVTLVHGMLACSKGQEGVWLGQVWLDRQMPTERSALNAPNVTTLPLLLSGVWEFHNVYFSIRCTPKGWSIQAQVLPPPPRTGLPPFRPIRKPILPEHHADLLGGMTGKRITREQFQDVWFSGQQALLDVQDECVLPPVAKGGKPEVPVKARLKGRINSRSGVSVLRFVSK